MSTIIFGGTFDPIHNAHLEMARAAAKLVEGARVLFVPAGTPPHRGTIASYADRLEMARLACLNEPSFEVSNLEEGSQKSYSILTIEKFRARSGGERLYFLIGADAFADIESWHRWREVVAAVEFIVVSRPRAEYCVPNGARVLGLSLDIDISSSQIRRELTLGLRPKGIPAAVLEYIRGRRLYSIP